MSSNQFFERNQLDMISNPSDITLDHQVNFEVNNPMPTYKDFIKLLFLVWHMLLG